MNQTPHNQIILPRIRGFFAIHRIFLRSYPVFIAIATLSLVTGLLVITRIARGESGSATENVVFGLGTLNGPNGFRIDGRAAGDQAGSALVNAGDVNGDGLDDFIISSPAAAPGGMQGAGEIYVIFGSVTNPPALPLEALNGNNGFRLSGVTYNDETGEAVGGGGDINRDGYDDLLIGAPGADPNDLAEAGVVYVVFGRATFPANFTLQSLNGSNGFRINGVAENDRTGTSVNQAGDVNGDGYDDIIIGAPDASPGGKEGIGQAFVVLGRAAFPSQFDLKTLNGGNGFQINGVAAESNAGKVVGSAGDMNGDGYDDSLITAWDYTAGRTLESGTVFILFGRASFDAKVNLKDINGSSGTRIEGITSGDWAGRSAVAAGDVNGDGRGDIAIGAPFAAGRTGEAYVVFGQTTFPAATELDNLNGANGFKLTGSEINGEAGTAVGAADVNGDGLEDVIIGASAAGTGSARFAGKIFVVFGHAGFGSTVNLGALDAGSGMQFDGAASGDQAGQTISAAGDINGDGFDEFLIGAPNAGPALKSDLGYIYLIQGGPTLGVTMPVTHPGTSNDDNTSGTGGVDVMLGGRGSDQINAVAGNDALKGGSGNDVLIGGPGGDRMVGGNGLDAVSYAGSGEGVTIDLFTGSAGGGDAAGDTFKSIERVTGSAAADSLTGDSGDNRLEGGGGNDTQNGGRGDDAFVYGPGSGNDSLSGFVAGAESEDYLDFSPYSAIQSINDLNVQPQGADTLITLPGGETIKLLNIAANTLHPDDYRLAGVPLARPNSYSTTANTNLSVATPGVLGNDDNPSQAALSAVLVDGPDHGTLTLQSNGAFNYVPVQNYLGTDEFTYRANNGQASNIARVSIEITPLPPTAVNDVYFVELGNTLTVNAPGVLGNDVSPGGLPLTADVIEEPVDGLLAFNPNGSFTYTPQVDYAAQDSFTYQTSNGLSSNIATVIINVIDPNGPPVASNDQYIVQVDKVLTAGAPGVLGNDINPLPGLMTAVLGDNPDHGSVTLNADGSFSYTPAAGYTGTDSFTYRANNGQLSNEATVTLTVSASGYLVELPVILRQ